MKLIHPCLVEPLNVVEDDTNFLVIENKNNLIRFIEDFREQVSGGEENFILSRDGMILSFDKNCEIILDPFSVDINNKKVLSTLHSKLRVLAYEDNNYSKTMELLSKIRSYFCQLEDNFNYSLYIDDDIDIQAISKAIGIKIDTSCSNFYERLVNYICLMDEVLPKELFVILNVGLYLNSEEIDEIRKLAKYKKITILFLEGYYSKDYKEYDNTTIIDKDLCVL